MIYLIDPYFTRRIYPFQISRSLEHQNLGFSVLSSTLIALYWYLFLNSTWKIVSTKQNKRFEQSRNVKKGQAATFSSKKYRIIAGIICSIYGVIDVAIIVERWFYVKFTEIDTVIGFVYYMSHLACLIFFLFLVLGN